MSKLPSIRRILKEDYQDAPPWFDRLALTLNVFMENVYGALNRNLSFPDNIRSQKKSFRITAGATPDVNVYTFTLENTWRPEGLIPIKVAQVGGTYTPLLSAVTMSWRAGDDNTVIIDAITGLTNGAVYDFTVLII